MTLFPHCIPTVSSLYPSKERWKALGGGGGGGRRRVVEMEGARGGGGGWQRQRAAEGGRGRGRQSMMLYPHCIPTVS